MNKKEEIIIHENQTTAFTDELKDHIEPIVEGITFNNVHLVGQGIYEKDMGLCIALINELEAQIRFGAKRENK